MTIRTLIIDDEPVALEKLRKYVESVPFLTLAAECHGTSEALEYLSREQVDVIFTDIEMPDVNGVSFIETLTPRPFVVFITAYRDYAVEGFRLSAIDYLVKPYRLVDFQRAANRVLEAWRYRNRAVADKVEQKPARASDSLFVKVETRYERVSLSDIRYIKGYGEYLQVYVEGQLRPLLTLSSFATVKAYLGDDFLQVHRSYIVNMNRIVKIEKNRIVMDAETYIPISSSYRDDFLAYVRTRSVGSARR